MPSFGRIEETAAICDQIKKDGHEAYIRENTGLVVDAYFSGTKVKWMLDQVEGARAKADKGDLLFGTVDSWLIWKLTNGRVHITDYTNASRTLMYNIRELKWDEKLLGVLNVPSSVLPTVKSSKRNIWSHYGRFVWQSHPYSRYSRRPASRFVWTGLF